MKKMKRRLALAALFAALFAGTAAAKDTLAVLPFTGGAGEEGETIAELFSFSDELNAAFAPIPRTSISRAVGNEQRFQTSAGMTDPDTIAALGKQLGAKYVVAGNIARLGNRNLLIISILKIDDLRQVAGDIQTYARIEELRGKLPGMARNIIAATQTDSSKLEKLAVLPVERGGGNIDSRVADALAQILSIYLIRSGKYAVYPRTATLEQVQAEYNTQLSGAVADENVVDMGKGENPRIVLSVVARRLGSESMFNASIINLETGVQLLGKSVSYEHLDDGLEAMRKLASELTGVTVGSAQDAAWDADDGDLEAIRAAAEGAGDRVISFWTGAAEGAGSGGGAAEKPVAEKSAVKKSGGGAAFGYGVLNLALGLGSFIQGDAGGGVTMVLLYGAAAGLVAWDLSLAYEDDLAGIPGGVGFGIAGFAVLYGFIRPFVYNRSRSLAEFMDGMSVAAAPAKRGGTAVRLSWTLKF
jgi:TolB-like protein